MICLSINRLRGSRCAANTNAVLNKPFVNGFGGMRHENPAFEVGLGQYVR